MLYSLGLEKPYFSLLVFINGKRCLGKKIGAGKEGLFFQSFSRSTNLPHVVYINNHKCQLRITDLPHVVYINNHG